MLQSCDSRFSPLPLEDITAHQLEAKEIDAQLRSSWGTPLVALLPAYRVPGPICRNLPAGPLVLPPGGGLPDSQESGAACLVQAIPDELTHSVALKKK